MTNHTALIEQLKTVSNKPSDKGSNEKDKKARTLLFFFGLTGEQKGLVGKQLQRGGGTNQYYQRNLNGVSEAINAIAKLSAVNDDAFAPKPPQLLTIPQLINRLETGKVFGVSFIKRSTGELRTMSARLGPKKFLRGGKFSYSPAEQQLLTIFDMAKQSYRSVPLDAIQRISVGGQSYNVAVQS